MKKKVLVVLVMVSLLVAVCGTVFATDITSTGNQITISNSATTGNSINITTTNTNTTGNTTNTLNVSSTYNTNSANTNTNTNTNRVNTSADSTLPKAGADTTVVFVILALVVSSAYAYKKVSDYNIDVQ